MLTRCIAEGGSKYAMGMLSRDGGPFIMLKPSLRPNSQPWPLAGPKIQAPSHFFWVKQAMMRTSRYNALKRVASERAITKTTDSITTIINPAATASSLRAARGAPRNRVWERLFGAGVWATRWDGRRGVGRREFLLHWLEGGGSGGGPLTDGAQLTA